MKEIQLKWPNDLMLNDSKVGGILIEARTQSDDMRLVMGVGVNLENVGSYQGIHKEISGEFVGEKIFEFVQRFLSLGFFPFKASFEEVLWKKFQIVKMLIQGEVQELEIRGVSDEGALIAHDSRKLILNSDGEILIDGQAPC